MPRIFELRAPIELIAVVATGAGFASSACLFPYYIWQLSIKQTLYMQLLLGSLVLYVWNLAANTARCLSPVALPPSAVANHLAFASSTLLYLLAQVELAATASGAYPNVDRLRKQAHILVPLLNFTCWIVEVVNDYGLAPDDKHVLVDAIGASLGFIWVIFIVLFDCWLQFYLLLTVRHIIHKSPDVQARYTRLALLIFGGLVLADALIAGTFFAAVILGSRMSMSKRDITPTQHALYLIANAVAAAHTLSSVMLMETARHYLAMRRAAGQARPKTSSLGLDLGRMFGALCAIFRSTSPSHQHPSKQRQQAHAHNCLPHTSLMGQVSHQQQPPREGAANAHIADVGIQSASVQAQHVGSRPFSDTQFGMLGAMRLTPTMQSMVSEVSSTGPSTSAMPDEHS
ncbi:hypothetical protein BC831DRAFT_453503 [Entophlyctis helioformis]|nr:hypothetical protein BC831DRAFT_453503 [Entophlyctis helioformis]